MVVVAAVHHRTLALGAEQPDLLCIPDAQRAGQLAGEPAAGGGA